MIGIGNKLIKNMIIIFAIQGRLKNFGEIQAFGIRFQPSQNPKIQIQYYSPISKI